MKKHFWTISFAALLVAFTVYVALDTFVISTVYSENATGMNMALFSEQAEQADDEPGGAEETETVAPYSDDTTYIDEDISIKLTEYEQYGTKIYVADVTMNSVSYLKTAFANDTYGKNVTAATSSIA